MSRARKVGAILGALALAGVAGAYWRWRARPRLALEAILPRETALLLEVDVAALRDSDEGRELLQEGELGRELADLGKRSGADPLRGIERLGVAFPVDGRSGDDAAIVAIGAGIRAANVAKCASELLRKWGDAPHVAPRGAYLEVKGNDAGRTTFVVRDGGPIVVARGRWLDDILSVAEGKQRPLGVDRRPRHVHSDAVATLTYALDEADRKRVRDVLPDSARVLAELGSVSGQAWIEERKVPALGVELEARCSGEACTELRRWLGETRDGFVAELGANDRAFAEVLRTGAIEAQNGAVRVSLAIPFKVLEHAWESAEEPDESALPSTVAPQPPFPVPEGSASGGGVGPGVSAEAPGAGDARPPPAGRAATSPSAPPSARR